MSPEPANPNARALARVDRVPRRTRGLLAIAIEDAIQARGLRPIREVLVRLRALFRLEMPKSAEELAGQLAHGARRSTAANVGCITLFALLVVPILLPFEILRGFRVRRHNEAMRRLLDAGELRGELEGANGVFAIDWSIWRDGTVCFAGTALGAVRGEEHVAPFFTVHRGPAPRGAIDAAALAKGLPDLPLVTTRWEWELLDPFEAVERASE